ncbi:MAG: stage V sporulation protein AC [Dethiobacteria bacterium]|jgi:stage V sporulation protein AC
MSRMEQNPNKELLLDKKWLNEWNRQKKPRPPLSKNIISAFLGGGAVCLLGQFILNLFISQGMPKELAGNPTITTIIFIAAMLTGLGVFDKMARIVGAGLAVPVTGFANSITSMAIEFKREGLVLGTGSKMFALAGSVIVFGVVTAFVVGIISALIH